MQSMKTHNSSYWFVAFILGSVINMSLFLFLPALGRTEPPPPPQVIELEFMAWQQPVQKKISKPKKVIPKPKKIPKPKPKPTPKPVKKVTKPKPKPVSKPVPQPVLAEKLIPDKSKPAIEPTKMIEESEEPVAPDFPVPKDAEFSDEALPVPTPIFQLTSLPRMIHRQTPVYPPSMKQQGKEATVKLEVLLDIKGKIRKVTVKKSGGEEFDQAAIEAIKNSTFMPANIEGKPVAVLMKIPVKFRLR